LLGIHMILCSSDAPWTSAPPTMPGKRRLPEFRMTRFVALLLIATVCLAGCKDDGAKPAGGKPAALKINGSTTVNLPAAEAAEILRAEKGMDIQSTRRAAVPAASRCSATVRCKSA
jgi:hypothetical protein